MSILRLAIPSPLRRQFDYLPPSEMSAVQVRALQPGIRVQVPFGRREVTGYLLTVTENSDIAPSALKAALQVLDETPLLDTGMLQLCDWAARYYHHPLGEVYSALFPKRLREGKATQLPGTAGWRRTDRGKGLPQGALARSPKQSQALDLLRATQTCAGDELKSAGISTATMRSLLDKGLVERCIIEQTLEQAHAHKGLELNPEQATAVETLLSAPAGFSIHLLEGVTGSGKTEVYLQLIAQCLRDGRQALVLIPEIGLTPQTLSRFQQRFQANIAVLHSGLTDAQRYLAWEEARNGLAHIVIGTRSAIFTPMPQLGLIVVDEEHDSSFKQQDGFRYSARDVAVKRAQLSNCPILLGSATPSLESIHNVGLGRYQHLQLTQRAGSGELPEQRAVDVRRQPLQAGLSPALVDAIEDTLSHGQQVLLFLNRRGYAPTLQCHDCGWIAECRACDARMTVHRRQHRLRCHHCGDTSRLPRSCPQCHSSALLTSGLGTEQTEDFLRERFPKWPCFRVDSDSMQNKDAMQSLVDQINTGEPGILLGTQMLTKGHHFPAVTLVAVIDADAMLFSADFRGEERMAQLLTQVAGRSGRADMPGTVLLQTHYPDHPLIQALLHTNYAAQARELLVKRQAAGLPPAGQLVIMRTDCKDANHAEQFLQALRSRVTNQLPAGASLIGPLPSPMQRRAGKFRCQLILAAPSRAVAQEAAGLLVAHAETEPARLGLKWSIDIDPQDTF